VCVVSSRAPYLGVGRTHAHRLSNLEDLRTDKFSDMIADTDLLINDDIDSHPLLGLALKDPIKAPLWVVRRRTA
jgi:hypothetical protein